MQRMYENIKAVFLDMDGTMLDTAEDLWRAACHAVESEGFPSFTLEEYKKVISYGIRDMYGRLLPLGTDPETVERVIAEHMKYYRQHCTEFTCWYPEMEAVLKELDRNEIKLAVITNKTEQTAVKIAAHYCKDIPLLGVWGNDGQHPLKPDPCMGLLVCEKLGVKPEEVLYAGDAGTDMRFAQNAGFAAAGAAWGYNAVHDLRENGADVVLERPEELLDIMALRIK